MRKEYDHKKIEKKWQSAWKKKKIYQIRKSDLRTKKFYVLDMFPYVSGEGIHVGHPKGYIATDIVSRMKRMQGFNVLHPMGFDAFGLPAENYAIKTKTNPAISVKKNIARFKKQLEIIGFDYDWEREINTSDPKFYKWTQWIFLKLLEHGLAYESNEPVNWCPKDKTVLANEDVEDGKCERCGTVVEKKPIRQWVLKITDYADRLLADLDELDWPESIKESQRNWIGRSEGINIIYPINGLDKTVTVFTTRPDTNFGATFIALAPDGSFVKEHLKHFPNKEKVQNYLNEVKEKTEIERLTEGRKKTGIFTGLYAVNGLNNKKMPMYVADFVLGGVGTGALVGVPGHDLRDFEFAQEMKLEIVRVVVGPDKDESPITKKEQVQESIGTMTGSEFLDGMEIHEATKKIMDHMEKLGMGKRTVTYKLHDWVFSRQRYWGEPIPVLRDGNRVIPVKEKDLPVKLPKVKSYKPTGTAESPLANAPNWINVPTFVKTSAGKKVKKILRRESNTMPQWAGSSWYYLRYMDPKNNKVLVDKKKEKYWNIVDLYVGGAEHATRHLIYARFWHKFLYDIGVVADKEPFKRLQHVGLIMGSDGRKMSKRFGNIINPDDIINRFGADTLRLYEMFMGPFDQAIAWSEDSLVGPRRFLERVWKMSKTPFDKNMSKGVFDIERLLHKTIKKVSEDIEEMKFNTAISSMMIFMNEVGKFDSISQGVYEKFLKLLSPFAPHITEEIWSNLGHQDSIHFSEWPRWDENLIKDEEVKIAVQINGKVRAEIMIQADEKEKEIKKKAIENEVVSKYIAGQDIKKMIYVKNRLINIVL